MAKKPDTTVKRAPDAAPAGPEVVIRDESDEIIDTLKRRLEDLQKQLAGYQAAERKGRSTGGGSAPPPHDRDRDKLAAQWNAGFAPYLAAKLQGPAEDLTLRLGRLAEQIQDQTLRQELERCRDTAFFLFHTFRRVRDNHRLLTESLIATRTDVSAQEFCAAVSAALRAQNRAEPKVSGLRPGQRIQAAPSSAGAVATTLVDLVATVFGTPVHVEVDLAQAASSGTLQIRILTDFPWENVEGEEVSNLAFRAGVRAHSVVDLLYVEKIAELQGGALRFVRRGAAVHGLEVSLPCR